jgi:ABC-type nitrate/sulfonate/bicarbonate transport system substrate-binding protein
MGLVNNNLYYKISSVADLVENWLDGSERKSIILSLRRDDHYATDQLLKDQGYQEEDNVYYVDQEDLIQRLYGLLNGNFISTVLPEPLLTLALKNPEFKNYQANLLSSYTDVTLPPFVLVFNRKVMKKNPELIESFYKGWEVARNETNKSSNIQLLDLATKIISETLPSLRNAIEQTELTEEFAGLFDIPEYSSPQPLDEEVYNSVLDWTISKGFLKKKIPYEQAFDGSSALITES